MSVCVCVCNNSDISKKYICKKTIGTKRKGKPLPANASSSDGLYQAKWKRFYLLQIYIYIYMCILTFTFALSIRGRNSSAKKDFSLLFVHIYVYVCDNGILSYKVVLYSITSVYLFKYMYLYMCTCYTCLYLSTNVWAMAPL